MRLFGRLLIATFAALSLVGAGSAAGLAHESGTLTDRGLKGGGKPWVIAEGQGEVGRDGSVEVRVEGLVIAVPPFNGTNPAKTFGAIVSCLTPHGVVNVNTAQFPPSPTGNAEIEGMVDLPHPCVRPIVFVIGSNPKFLSVPNST
jgi:hypothetical protein